MQPNEMLKKELKKRFVDIPQFLVFLVLNMAVNDAVNLSDNRSVLDPNGDIGLCIPLQKKKPQHKKSMST